MQPGLIIELNHKEYNSVNLDNIDDYDAVIIVTDHSSFDYKDILERAKLILDTRYAYNGIKADNLVRM